jgi:hypothetical protein
VANDAIVEPEFLLLMIAFVLLVAWEIKKCLLDADNPTHK